ncbi:MAG TPA: NADH-quinone oxidoreductase subunit J [Candidatus Polarisedimenticolaceae bacterium]
MSDLLFWALAVVLVAFALGVVRARTLWRAAYALAGALVTTAMFYMLLTAPLLAAVQILLYTGGVLTLVVFAIVVTRSPDAAIESRRPAVAAGLALLVFGAALGFVAKVQPAPGVGGLDDGARTGIALFSDYLVPFELLSVLLLAALFGALVIARREERP